MNQVPTTNNDLQKVKLGILLLTIFSIFVLYNECMYNNFV